MLHLPNFFSVLQPWENVRTNLTHKTKREPAAESLFKKPVADSINLSYSKNATGDDSPSHYGPIRHARQKERYAPYPPISKSLKARLLEKK